MARSVLICSTAWKASLTPDEANRLISEALLEARPDWHVTCLPLADGGDGWLECLCSMPNHAVQSEKITVTGPVPGQQVEARYLRDPENHRIFLESAEIHGMRRLPGGRPQALLASSYGVGEAMVTLIQQYPETQELVVSVGGSASTDGGLGFLQALGWRFFEASGACLKSPIGAEKLLDITHAEPPQARLAWPSVTLLTDVETRYTDSPKLFGPQKGVAPDWIEPLVNAFHRIAGHLDPSGHRAELPGSGAAGGLPFGMVTAIPEANIVPGIRWTAEQLGFSKALSQADVVITGEGRFDETSLLGKVTGYVIDAAQGQQKPALVLCGQTSFPEAFRPGVRVQPLYTPGENITAAQFAETPERIKKALWVALSAIE